MSKPSGQGETAKILIESILGGHSLTSHFAARDQFRASLGIDPAQPVGDNTSIASGLLRPTASTQFGTPSGVPRWIKTSPKDANFNIFVYDGQGSAYTMDPAGNTISALSDGGTLSSSSGNGCEYYDNYLYFFKNTDVARYGPLDGVPAFTGTYWTGTLGKTALVNTTYPADNQVGVKFPNHVAHRHSDGRLYFADVVGNQGTLHFIATTKGAVEGDTDNGSTYNKLQFGYGLWPTALESYGADLVIALFEGGASNLSSGSLVRSMPAKIGFWDTTSTNFNKIVWVEFPDQIISAMKNIDGVLYVVSGNINGSGFRVSRYVGGYTFREVAYSETGEPCHAGAIDGVSSQLLFGNYTNTPENAACVYSLGLQKAGLSKGLFNVMRATGGTIVTAVALVRNVTFNQYAPVIGWTNGVATHGLDDQAQVYNNAPSVWWSQMYRIGRPFRIQRVRIPFAQAMAANMTVTPKIYTDDGTANTTLPVLNSTNFPPGAGNYANIKVGNVMGYHNFYLELRWTGSTLCTIGLPIQIDIELIDDL